MSKQLNIHLFNCDRTYKLDVVEKWLNAARVKSKLGIDFEVKQHIFPLSKMTELCSETIPSLQMDVAVFVVHAHESRLSINEENAGIGYAKLYRALVKGTGDNVLIVIGGDDSYKDKNEEDTAFISRWAKRKISSQFSEELIDGRKSFIFSWNQEHRAIHEEALVHFLDDGKGGKKFEYQPKGKSSQVSETIMSPTANNSTWEKDPRERKSTQKGNGSDTTRLDTTRGKGVTENRTPHTGKDGSFGQIGKSHPQGGTEPFQSNSVRKASLGESTSLHTRKEDSSRMNEGDRSVGYHPLQKDTSRKSSSSGGYTPLHSGKEGSFRGMGESDDSVGVDLFQSDISQNSSLSDYKPFHSGNEGSFGLTRESDHSVGSDPLRSGAFGNSSSGVDPSPYSNKPGGFEDLAAAESKKAHKKDLSIIGWNASPEAMSTVDNLIETYRDVLCLSTDTDCFNGLGVNDVISYFEHNPLKYCVLLVDADKFMAMLRQERGINLRLSQTADRNVEKGIIFVICCPWIQSEQDKTLVRSAVKKAVNDSRKVFIIWFENGDLVVNPHALINFLTSNTSSQQASAAADGPPRGITGKQPLPYPWNYQIYLPSGKTVFALTRIRKGIISDLSNRPEDVQYWKPGFVVPSEIKDDLYKKNAKTSNVELFILMTKEGRWTCQVDKKNGKEWENFITLGLDEIIVLKTQLRHGQISFQPKDLVVNKGNLRVPQDEITKLEKEYEETPTADLFVTSDPKGNSRCLVKVGARSQMFTFINALYNQAAGRKANLI